MAAAEDAIENMPNKPSISHDGGDRAYYRPLEDSIHLPPRAAFSDAGEYYSTVFHELSHSTGHESRLNRHGLETGIAAFGSATYSREELAAEFGSAFITSAVGITNTIPQPHPGRENQGSIIPPAGRLAGHKNRRW